MATLTSLCVSNLQSRNQFLFRNKEMRSRQYCIRKSRLIVLAITKGSEKSSSKSDEKIPSWAKPGSNEPPPWASGENKGNDQSTNELPYYAYLLASAVTAIAAVGSIFEYVNKKPVFGVLNPDSMFYVPLLGFFVFTGFPTSAYLWYKSVQAANKEAEEQDRRDGFL